MFSVTVNTSVSTVKNIPKFAGTKSRHVTVRGIFWYLLLVAICPFESLDALVRHG